MDPLRRILVSVALALAACSSPLPEPPERGAGSARDAVAALAIEPDSPAAAAPPVLRLHVSWPERAADSADEVRLFRGLLSSYHVGRIRERAAPDTLLERVVPALAWSTSGREIVVAPSLPLAPGESYTLAAPASGVIAEISISAATDAPLMARRWPPADAGAGVERAIFCGDTATPEASAVVSLDPLGLAAEVASPGGGTPLAGCLQLTAFEPAPEGALLVPPVRALGFALDPAPFAVTPLPELSPLACAIEESALGPGCALVEDDRLILRGLELPTFWILEGAPVSFSGVLEPGQRQVVRGLKPGDPLELSFTVIDPAGRSVIGTAMLSGGPPRARVVVNEVLADALGPEPAQEWVELVNDGTEAVELEGWVIEDVGGRVPLPAQLLEPGAFALLVAEGFSESSPWDAPPEPGTPLLRLPSLGKSGLANSGEPLILRAPDGAIVSRFPASPKPKPGVSVARRVPWALDDVASSFALHGGNGASPGAPNVVPDP